MASTDTLAFADVKLPALAWGEKDGTVTNSERRISRQRPLFAPPGQARADWRIVAEVATAMGFGDAFGWRSPAQVFREWARLSTYENHGSRILDLGSLAAVTPDQYQALEPVQWPVTPAGGTPRLFTDGAFQTPDGKARMVAVQALGPAEPAGWGFPFSLNTGRVRDHWHTMTRTGLAADLCRHAPEPFVEVHPDDAEPLGVADGALARVRTPYGEAVAIARVTDRQRRGSLFVPMHWTDAFAPSARANPLTGPHVDPVSGQPEFKHAPARLSAYRETWRGFLIVRTPQALPAGLDLIWRRTPQDACQLHEFAGRGDRRERDALLAAFPAPPGVETLSLEDPATGAVRRALLKDGRLEQVLFLTVSGRLPPREWLAGLFDEPEIGGRDRITLLAGRSAAPAPDTGPVVCACLKVGASAIRSSIAAGAASVDAVGTATRAGTNCGSCRPEIARLIAAQSQEKAKDAA
jgi:assimilatory nitrate reductase catalytic subunit